MCRLYHCNMVNKIISVLIGIIFPHTHLERYLSTCSHISFLQRMSPMLQNKDRMLFPFQYRNPFTRDCIIELKERNNVHVARLFAPTLAYYILNIINTVHKDSYFIVPVPQHISKTRDKGFLHTQTLCNEMLKVIQTRSISYISIFPCVAKVKKTKRLHDINNKQKRFRTIKDTMRATLTRHDANNSIFFIVDDVFTTGATFKEIRRTLIESGAHSENLYFISIAH